MDWNEAWVDGWTALDVMAPVLVVALGLIFGSFLNVCIYRLPLDLSVVKPRSFCPACKTTIRSYHNVPVLSWIALGGRCAYCGARISWRYSFVEAVTGALFYAAYRVDGLSGLWAFDAYFMASMLALIFTDIDHQILPNEITYSGTVVGVLGSLVNPRVTLLDSAAAAFLGGGFLLGMALVYQRIRKREGMGLGDVKMIIMIGAFLGVERMLATLVIGSILGLLIGGGALIVSKRGLEHPIPFGTFLGAAAIVNRFFGDAMMAAWSSGVQRTFESLVLR